MKINKTNKTETKTEGFFQNDLKIFQIFLDFSVFSVGKGPFGPFFRRLRRRKGGRACGAPLSFSLLGRLRRPIFLFFLLVRLRRAIPFPFSFGSGVTFALVFRRFRSVSVHLKMFLDVFWRCEVGV